KGVVVTHAGVAGLSSTQRERLGVDRTSRVLQFASPGFDAAWWELCMALLSGAALVVDEDDRPPHAGPADDGGGQGGDRGARLGDVIALKGVTHVTLPPALVATLDDDAVPPEVTMVVAGEACAPEVVDRWARGRRFVNAYGPTE
ncbi:AMP-binding protein, partial [Streptomyces cacaoi]